ncbi:MAG: hypothetical protein J6R77_04605 [Clostridia bacterium]|nr:hypothetical protein [Clostridia bacterium]
MANRLLALLLALLIASVSFSVSAAGNETLYILSQEGSTFTMNQQEGELAFWEAPDVTTGQSHAGGTLTLRNDSNRPVDFVLSSVSLPYGNEAALTYLDAVTLIVKQGETEVYHGTFTHLMDTERPEIRLSDVLPGEQAQLTLSISCAYTYTGGIPSYNSLVWTFTPELKGTTTTTAPDPLVQDSAPPTNWKMIAQIAGVVALVMAAAGIAVWLTRIIRKK